MNDNTSYTRSGRLLFQYVWTRLLYAVLILVFLVYVTFFGLSMARGIPLVAALR